jgi:hypothetical protein
MGIAYRLGYTHPGAPTPMRQARPVVLQTISDNELRLRQIDSDIDRLNAQLAYLHRVRVKYAALAEAERKSRGKC